MSNNLVVVIISIIVIVLVIICGFMAGKLKEGMLSGTVPFDTEHVEMNGMGGLPHHSTFGPSHDSTLYEYQIDNTPTEQCWYVDVDRLNGYETESDDEDNIYCEASRQCSSAFRFPPPGGMPDASRITGIYPDENDGIGKLTGAGGGILWSDRLEERQDAIKQYSTDKIDNEQAKTIYQQKQSQHTTSSQTKSEDCASAPFSTLSTACKAKGGKVIGMIANYASGCNILPSNVEYATIEEVNNIDNTDVVFPSKARVMSSNGNVAEVSVQASGATPQSISNPLWTGAQRLRAPKELCSRTGNPSWHSHAWVKATLPKGESSLPNVAAATNWNWMENMTFFAPNS